MTTWRWALVALALFALLATALTAVIDADSAHFLTEPNLSTGELLSPNWWHPLVRLAAVWLWLTSIVFAVILGLIRLVAWFQRRTAIN